MPYTKSQEHPQKRICSQARWQPLWNCCVPRICLSRKSRLVSDMPVRSISAVYSKNTTVFLPHTYETASYYNLQMCIDDKRILQEISYAFALLFSGTAIIRKIISISEDLTLDLTFGKLRMKEHVMLYHDDLKATNCADNACVTPVQIPLTNTANTRHTVTLPKHSWHILRFETV